VSSAELNWIDSGVKIGYQSPVKIKETALLLGVFWIAAVAPAMLNAQTISILHSFVFPAENPQAPLAQGPDGTLYGTAYEGGNGGYGTVFKVSPNGTGFTDIYNFYGGADGANPCAGLLLAGTNLFGTTYYGGSNGSGTVFMLGTNGAGFTVLKTFSATNEDTGVNSDGADPNAGLALAGGVLFGTAYGGGTWGNGVVFSVGTNGDGFTVLTNFPAGNTDADGNWTNADGACPCAGLLLAGTNLFGTAYFGGSYGSGTVFKLGTNGAGFTVLSDFSAGEYNDEDIWVNVDGAYPYAGLILSGATLYGAAEVGGEYGNGTVFALGTNGGGFSVLSAFSAGNDNTDDIWTNSYGAYPDGTLLLSGNFLFGTAYGGGEWGNGSVFTLSAAGGKFTNLYSFNTGDDGANPLAGLVLSGPTLYGTASAGGNWGAGTAYSVNTNRTGFGNFYIFDSTDGLDPLAGLLLSGNTIYGTTFAGGSSSNGMVFKAETNGTAFTVLANFPAADPLTGTNPGGANPQGNLVLSGATLFGTATGGGTGGQGTVFSIGTNGGALSVLWDFSAAETNSFGLYTNADGVDPEAGLLLAGGALFGTTYEGGASGAGTVFTINTNTGVFKQLWNFAAGGYNEDDVWTNADGAGLEAGLALAGTNLFGTAYYGGSNGNGTVFMLGTNGGPITVLKTFSALDPDTGTNTGGANPYAGLILSGATLFGTAEQGGTAGAGTVFALATNGGGFNVLWDFSAPDADTETNTDGAYPDASLILSSNTLFGTTSGGGFWAGGAIFQINTNGSAFENLHNFDYYTDGGSSYANLILSGHLLFGTASQGGVSGGGTVFGLDTTLNPPSLAAAWSGVSLTVSWPSPSAGFVLQQNTNLGAANWASFPGAIIDNGISNSAAMTPSRGGLFLRLYHP
jgi:uncharacterized repeat protein (TIGR03803 family)